MPQFSKFTIELPKEIAKQYEKSSRHMSALLKGARARQQGQPRESCPYDFNKAAGYYFAWSHGWIGMDNGTIVIKDDEPEKPKEEVNEDGTGN